MPLEPAATAAFVGAAAQIVLIDLLLGGDNAVVIALASRRLPLAQRRRAILWGTLGAVGLRIVLTLFAVRLLQLPWLKLLGAVLLAWIGMRLMLPDEAHPEVQAADRLWVAVRLVITADLVMSLDNVVAIAGAARNAATAHQGLLVAFGLALSVPIVVWGSSLVIRLMTRFPWVVALGALMLGWIAGGLAAADPAVEPWLHRQPWGAAAHEIGGGVGVLAVWLGGQALRLRRAGAAGG